MNILNKKSFRIEFKNAHILCTHLIQKYLYNTYWSKQLSFIYRPNDKLHNTYTNEKLQNQSMTTHILTIFFGLKRNTRKFKTNLYICWFYSFWVHMSLVTHSTWKIFRRKRKCLNRRRIRPQRQREKKIAMDESINTNNKIIVCTYKFIYVSQSCF